MVRHATIHSTNHIIWITTQCWRCDLNHNFNHIQHQFREKWLIFKNVWLLCLSHRRNNLFATFKKTQNKEISKCSLPKSKLYFPYFAASFGSLAFYSQAYVIFLETPICKAFVLAFCFFLPVHYTVGFQNKLTSLSSSSYQQLLYYWSTGRNSWQYSVWRWKRFIAALRTLTSISQLIKPPQAHQNSHAQLRGISEVHSERSSTSSSSWFQPKPIDNHTIDDGIAQFTWIGIGGHWLRLLQSMVEGEEDKESVWAGGNKLKDY